MNFYKTVTDNNLFNKNETILAAVSGGADSVAMLHLINSIKVNLSLNIKVIHFNHHLRDKNSDLDAQFVKEISDNLELDSKVIDLDVINYSKVQKKGIEESARYLRYSHLKEEMKNQNADKIAVAHNQDDKIETILLNIMRGTGLTGLSPLNYNNNNIIRPMLDTSKSDILRYLSENNIPFRLDESNIENHYSRNKVRNQLLPYIKENFNSNIISAIENLSSIAQETNNFLTSYTNNWIANNIKNNVADINDLKTLSPAIKHLVIREMIKEFKGSFVDITLSEITRIDNFINSGKPFKTALIGGNGYAVSNGTSFYIEDKASNIIQSFTYELNTSIYIPELKLFVTIEKVQHPAFNLNDFYFIKTNDAKLYIKSIDNKTKSEYISPLGMQGKKKKISDILKDKKVPLKERNNTFILADQQGNNLWIPGIITSELARLKTNNYSTLYKISIKS